MFDMKEYQLGDYTIYIPSEGNSNGYYEFPACINMEIQPFYIFRDLIEKIKKYDVWDFDAFLQ